MFAFGQEQAPAKTEASKKKPHRRVSLANRSLSSHRNEENMVPAPSTPRGHKRRASIVGKGAPLPGQQAFLQAAMPSANGACPGPTTPSRPGAGGRGGGGGGGGGTAATQMFNQNFELKRRQQELESMVQGYEEKNTQLDEQNSKAKADLERANARADSATAEAAALRRDAKTASAKAKSTSAEIAGLRRDASTATEEIARLRRDLTDLTTARDEGARALEQARAEAEVATARAETAELANARASEELGRAKEEAAAKAEDAARKAARALKAEVAKVAKATAAAAAARKAAASAEATAAAAVAQAEKEHSQQQKQKHESDFQSLAAGLKAIATGGSVEETDTSSRPNPGKKRGRGGASSAAGGAGTGTQRAAKLAGGGVHGDEGRGELPELTKGFCKFLAAYTGRDLPQDALLQLLGATVSLGKGGVLEGDDGEKGVLRAPPPSGALEGAKHKPRAAAAVRQEKPASAAPAVDTATAIANATTLPAATAAPASAVAPAVAPAVVVTPPESVVPTARPTTSRREMLNARLAQKEKEAKEKERVQEEQERRKAERQREARQRRKKEAVRAKAAEDARAKKVAAEAAAHQQAVEATAARDEAALTLSSAVPPPPPPLPEQEREQPQPQSQPQTHRQTHKQPHQTQKQQKQEADVKKNPTKVQHVKSKRAKQTPVQQQQHAQSPAKWTGGGTNASSCGRITTGSLADVPTSKPSLPNPTPGRRVTSASGAETQATGEAASDRIVDHDEMAGVVEEVPMPTGDIDDGLDFFCAPADVGGGGAIGLIVGGGGGGGGDGYGMVGAWPQLQGDAIAATVDGNSSGAFATFPGEKINKGKGSPRKPEPVEECATEAGSTGAGDFDEKEGGGKESKKKRRRSMRSTRAPIKFGSDEPKVEEVSGAGRSSESKRGHTNRLAPALATPAGSAAAVEVSFDSGGVVQQTNSVTPAQVSRGQPSEGDDPVAVAAPTFASAAPGAAAANEIASASTSAALRAGFGSAAAGAVVAGAGQRHQGPPTKRKPSATLNYRRNVRVNRVRAGVVPAVVNPVSADGAGAGAGEAAAAAAAAASAPFYPEMQTEAVTSDFFAAAASETATSPEQSISATAKVAQKAMDSLFDTAVLQLSAAKQPSNPGSAAKPAAASRTKIVGSARATSAKSVSDGAVTTAGAGRVAKPKRKAEVAVAPAAAPALMIAVEDLLPFGAEVTDAVTARDIFEAVSSGCWIGGGSGDGGVGGAAEGGPWGVLTGVLATAHALMEKHFEVSRSAGGSSSALAAGPPDAARQHLRSLLTAIVATEACAIRHELLAGTEAGETAKTPAAAVAAGAGVGTETTPAGVSRGEALAAPAPAVKAKTSASASAGGSRKKVRFCAFDLSTVDMPSDAVEDSDVAAKEVAQCLACVIASSKLVQKALPKGAANGGRSGGGIADVLRLFMRGLKTVVVAAVPGHSSSPLAASVKDACHELGSDISSEVVGRAAVFLLKSLESLGGGDEVAARCPFRRRLAGMLSALIRHNLRILLNPPPPKSLSSLHIAADNGEGGPLKVYEVIQLMPEKTRPGQKKDGFDPTRDGATSAVLSRALRRLHGFTEKGAVEVMSTAEAFVAVAKDKEKSVLSVEERVVQARRHCRDTVDILAASRARNFVLELLGFSGVELAVSQARGWGELERLSTELREVKDSPDADASFSLLADVRGLKAWLRQESLWGHDQRAIAVLTKLDAVLVGCDRKEAKRLSQEARRRMWFPRVMEAPEPLQEAGNAP